MPTFNNIFAIDPIDLTKVAANAEVVIFAPGDESMTPLVLTDVDGLPLPNPITTSEQGFGPAFIAPLDTVAWAGGGLSNIMESYSAVKEIVAAARDAAELSAQESAESKTAAQAAGVTAGIDAAAQVQVELAANRDATEQAAMDAATAKDSAVAAALLVGAPAGDVVRTVVNSDMADSDSDLATALSAAIDDRAVKRGEFFINALDYGLVGDGVTENDAAWADVINTGVAFGPKTIIVPAGSYYAKHAPRLLSGTTIQGEGRGQTFFVKRAGRTATCYFSILSQGATGYGSGAQNVTIRDVTFKGDFANNIKTGAIGANHGSNILIERVDFVECLGAGHIFDLQGCDGARFVDCRFYGAQYPDEAASYNEAIQLDNSTRNGTSVLDAPGSYDGLPTKNVELLRCQFLPITVGGVEYPAPIPIGSHAGVGDYWHENIRIRQCIIDTPGEDQSSNYRGIFHWVAARDIILDDVWIFNRKNVVARAFATIAQTSSIPLADADVAGAVSVLLPTPKSPSGIKMRNVKLVGFSNSNTAESVLRLRGHSATSLLQDVVLEDVSFVDSYVTDLSLGTGSMHIELAYADNVTIRGGGTNGCRRFVYYATVSNLTVANVKIKNSSTAVPINGVNGVNIKLHDIEFDNYHGAIYDTLSVGLEIRGIKLKNARSTNAAAVDINNSKRFKVTGCDGEGASGIGIRVRGASTGGIVTANDMTGFVTPYSVSSDSVVTTVANLPA